VSEFESDHAAADEDNVVRQRVLVQHVIGDDHVMGALDRQRPWRRTGRNDDVIGFKSASIHLDRIWPRKGGTLLDHFDAALLQPPEEPGDLLPIERQGYLAVRGHAFLDIKAEMAGGQRLRRLQQDVVHVIALLAADLDRVPMPARCEQRRPRPRALDQGIDGERRSVHQHVDVRERRPGVGHGLGHDRHDPLGGIRVGRQALFDDHPAGTVIDQHQVRECPADIDPHPHGYHPGPRDRSAMIPDVV